MKGLKTLLCSLKFPWARERIHSNLHTISARALKKLRQACSKDKWIEVDQDRIQWTADVGPLVIGCVKLPDSLKSFMEGECSRGNFIL